MLLQVGYEGDKVKPQNRVLVLSPALPTSAGDTLPDQVWRLSLKIAFANIFGTYPAPAYTAHRGLLLRQGLGCHQEKHSLQKCKVFFSCNAPRRSIMRSAVGERWVTATHSAPREDSEAGVGPFHTAAGARALGAGLIANAALWLSWGGGGWTPWGTLAHWKNMAFDRYFEPRYVFLLGERECISLWVDNADFCELRRLLLFWDQVLATLCHQLSSELLKYI